MLLASVDFNPDTQPKIQINRAGQHAGALIYDRAPVTGRDDV
jgi:hypothetical protein